MVPGLTVEHRRPLSELLSSPPPSSNPRLGLLVLQCGLGHKRERGKRGVRSKKKKTFLVFMNPHQKNQLMLVLIKSSGNGFGSQPFLLQRSRWRYFFQRTRVDLQTLCFLVAYSGSPKGLAGVKVVWAIPSPPPCRWLFVSD